MSWLSAALFSWIQAAPFYVEAHAQAVALLPQAPLPPGQDSTWLDVGCGPGLVTRLASERGYRALGVDRDAAMIRAATKRAPQSGVAPCQFARGDLDSCVAAHSADVVSAASLLILLPEPKRALAQLWSCVNPGGTLLVVETTDQMSAQRVKELARTEGRYRHRALWLWARARRGRAFDPAHFAAIGSSAPERHLLLGGLVAAWTLHKGTER